ncbi:outer membrane beta-barrel protein [Dyella marensis]|uniref:Outer membrane protein beta-barrel domain-containing protein n=1 Tax=Dyella marensis TaxID=500610 RepID=A0A1I2IJJ6_9GAMM|nr:MULTISPECIES: outer membrane beta-barrel protein [Dyella]SFF41026.1 Outer membrane protein beta-barrel domain-containing protein [Dyella marensis]
MTPMHVALAAISLGFAAAARVAAAASPVSPEQRHGAYVFAAVKKVNVYAAAAWDGLRHGQAQHKSKSSGAGYGIGLGYRFGDHFAVEAGYGGMTRGANVSALRAGGGQVVNAKFQKVGVQLSALGIMPLGNRFELYGKVSLGYMQDRLGPVRDGVRHNAEARNRAIRTGRPVRVQRYSRDVSESGMELSIGLGAQWYLNKQLAIRGEISNLSAMGKKIERTAVGRKLRTSQMSLGLLYHFD